MQNEKAIQEQAETMRDDSTITTNTANQSTKPPTQNEFTQVSFTKEEQEKLEELCLFAFDCARENDVQSLKTLLDSGLNVNLANEKGNTLVMLASYNGNFEATKLLLESGAKVDKKNDKNLTPLAGVTFKGYYDIAKLLLDFGANPLEVSGKGLSPMNCAIFFGRKDFIALFTPYTKGRLSLFQKICAWFYNLKKEKNTPRQS